MAIQYNLFGGSTNLQSVEIKVEQVLRDFPECRGLDKDLILRVWLEADSLREVLNSDEGLIEKFAVWFVTQATLPESITRARRAIQAEGRYLPDPKHRARREKRQAEYRNRYRRGG